MKNLGFYNGKYDLLERLVTSLNTYVASTDMQRQKIKEIRIQRKMRK